jgi:hypothetical protein
MAPQNAENLVPVPFFVTKANRRQIWPGFDLTFRSGIEPSHGDQEKISQPRPEWHSLMPLCSTVNWTAIVQPRIRD